MNSHNIVLIQYTQAPSSRTFFDYKSVPLAAAGVTNIFERHLKEVNPHIVNITYDIKDLYRFIDQLTDLSALVYDAKLKAYIPYAKSWMKEQVAEHIRKQLQGRRR